MILDCCNVKFPGNDIADETDVGYAFTLLSVPRIGPNGRAVRRLRGRIAGAEPIIPYVVLVACRENERAFEEASRGWFTRVLLETMRAAELRSNAVTYQDLVHRIPNYDEYV